MDYRRLIDVENILEQKLTLVMKYLKEAKGFKEEKIAIGFMNEPASQLTASAVRPKVIKNITKMKTNTINFYVIDVIVSKTFLRTRKPPPSIKA